MPTPTSFLIFSLDDRRYALTLDAVVRVVRLVDINQLPRAPDIVLGVIDVVGAILPVINVRRRLGLPERAPRLNDVLIIARAGDRDVALLVDAAHGVAAPAEQDVTAARAVFPGLQEIEGVIRTGADLALIEDLGRFLTPAEATGFEAALNAARSAPVEAA